MEHKRQRQAREALQRAGLLEGPEDITYREFLKEHMPPESMESLAQTAGGYEHPDFIAAMQAFYTTYIIEKSGGAVFTLTPDLIHALRDTEIPDVLSHELRLPFAGINIDFPAGSLNPPAETVSRILLSRNERDRFRVLFFDTENTHYMNFDLVSGATLSKCVSLANNDWHKLATPDIAQKHAERAMYANYYDTDAFRLAVNTALYITSPDADVVEDKRAVHALHNDLQGTKKGRKRDALLEKLSRAKLQKRYIVGAKFRMQKEYTAALTDTGKAWVLNHRVHVMGHWKNQPHGPRNELRKRVWVAPYWKGPTYAEMLEKGYVVR